MKRSAITIISFLSTIVSIGQEDIDSVVASVRRNNTAIQANSKYLEAKRQENRTGLTLYDPQVEYDYLFGSPSIVGNQHEFSVTQRLDFPTAYGKKRKLADRKEMQIENQQHAFSQNILLDAKLIALDLVYLNKRSSELSRRLSSTVQLVRDYQRKMELGEAIILDVNKAKVQQLNLQTDVALNENERKLLLTRLTELNGGILVDVRDTVYPLVAIPRFEVLDSLIEANDPELKVYLQEQEVVRQQIEVQRALNLPKLEAGYHSQGILGQSYRGFHTGITIPLWENRNRVKSAEANLEYVISNTTSLRLKHRLESRRLYEQLEVRRTALTEYNQLLPSLNNTPLLNKALRLGQITVIQYFQDESFYFSSYDRYLQVEREYHKAVAQLFKFLL